MPATNPRLSVTVSPRVDAVLTRFAAATSKSKSAIVGEILEESCDMFAKMVKVMEAAKEASGSMAQAVVEPFEKANNRVQESLGLVLDEVGTISDDLLEDVESIARRARKERGRGHAQQASGRPRAPLSNRGGRKRQVLENKGKPKS